MPASEAIGPPASQAAGQNCRPKTLAKPNKETKLSIYPDTMQTTRPSDIPGNDSPTNQSLPLKTLLASLEQWAPFAWQESYDNAGLILGDPNQQVRKALVCFDVTPEVVDEAVRIGADLILSHHPAIFKGIKRINPASRLGYMIKQSLCHDIAWCALHTNLDNTLSGVNSWICEHLGLQEVQPLVPLQNLYGKLQVYVPEAYAEKLRQALAEAGCGAGAKYDACSYTSRGEGRFRAGSQAHPFAGQIGELHCEAECKIECLYPLHKTRQVVEALRANHPYEEPAFDLLPLQNEDAEQGAGAFGILQDPMQERELLDKLKELTGVHCIRHSGFRDRKIQRIALCGGSGGSFIGSAQSRKADVYITGDLKYHDFTDAEPGTWLVDIGHFESEKFAMELILRYIRKNFPNFAVFISEQARNPVSFY